MTKKELIEKMESCRALADEILDDVQSMEGKANWELVYRAERVLDAADFFLIYLNREGEQWKS